MLKQNDRQHELMAAFWQGLSHPIRLRILALLREHGSLNVGDMVTALGIGQGHLSNHLSCLKSCGFVVATPRGRFMYYQIADSRVNDLLDLGLAMMQDHAEGVAACVVVGPANEPNRGFFLPPGEDSL
ncbi:MAG: metalloregulator ArsR/SmtB family transcription factor [Sulfobacillus thermotolerans]|nr:metalloregulator ArsR/SmtB family transcription factor [Sulfobacillus thermotolerans]